MKTTKSREIRRLACQVGQGMTEYIIIVAVIGIASIAVYTLFGDVLRHQTAASAAALSGGDGSSQMSSARNTAIAAGMEAGVGGNLQNFAENPTPN